LSGQSLSGKLLNRKTGTPHRRAKNLKNWRSDLVIRIAAVKKSCDQTRASIRAITERVSVIIGMTKSLKTLGFESFFAKVISPI
jgi:hypothetical protein